MAFHMDVPTRNLLIRYITVSIPYSNLKYRKSEVLTVETVMPRYTIVRHVRRASLAFAWEQRSIISKVGEHSNWSIHISKKPWISWVRT